MTYIREIILLFGQSNATLGYAILTPAGATLVARTTAGITAQGTVYLARPTCDTAWGNLFTVVWDDGVRFPRETIDQSGIIAAEIAATVAAQTTPAGLRAAFGLAVADLDAQLDELGEAIADDGGGSGGGDVEFNVQEVQLG